MTISQASDVLKVQPGIRKDHPLPSTGRIELLAHGSQLIETASNHEPSATICFSLCMLFGKKVL